jgi:hypothetical protein
LQTPEVTRVELTASPQHGGNTRATSNLIQRPDLVRFMPRSNKEQTSRVNGQARRRRSVKATVTIDDD